MQLSSSTTTLSTSNGYTIVSDGQFKGNVSENTPGLEFINKLRPVSYNFNYKRYDDFLHKNTKRTDSIEAQNPGYQRQLIEKSSHKEIGFIAQDVEKLVNQGYVFTGLYTPKNDGDNYAIDYGRFTVPLVKAVQELSRQNEELKTENEQLKKDIKAIKEKLGIN